MGVTDTMIPQSFLSAVTPRALMGPVAMPLAQLLRGVYAVVTTYRAIDANGTQS